MDGKEIVAKWGETPPLQVLARFIVDYVDRRRVDGAYAPGMAILEWAEKNKGDDE